MKPVVIALALTLALPALAHPKRLGTITADATTAKNNSSTGTPFNATGSALANLDLLIQCDAATWVEAVGTSSGATTKGASGTGTYLDTNQLFPMQMGPGAYYVSVLADSGTANCRVYLDVPKRVAH
jgi:hypothetical protein